MLSLMNLWVLYIKNSIWVLRTSNVGPKKEEKARELMQNLANNAYFSLYQITGRSFNPRKTRFQK